jgi:hypothetical protein
MKKSLMLGAMALAAVATASSAQAKKYEFGLYTAGGGAYCDGLQFTASGGVAVGQHIYDQVYCVYPDGNLGGFESKIAALGGGKWYTLPVSLATGDGDPQSYTLVFYANVKALEWVLAYENTDYGVTFSELNSGTLQKGPPFSQAHGKKLGSALKVGLSRLKK